LSLASQFRLCDLLGKHVRTTRSFPLLPEGSTGEVIDICAIRGRPPEIVVQWDEHNFKDAFDRDKTCDETEWLEVIDCRRREISPERVR
jgi:hypothetical protein